jgi:hypothetical protein
MFDAWTDGIFSPLAEHAERVVREDGVRLHTHARAVHSSMVFAFNLFLPFRVAEAAALNRLISTGTGLDLHIDRVMFEYGPTEILAETRTDPPSPDDAWTSADVGLEVRDGQGRRGIVLVEVKLSEDGFSRCNGRTSRGNRRLDICASARSFFEAPRACYLTRPIRASRERRYWDIFDAAHGSVRAAFPHVHAGACPFASDAQQLMRNHALALGLVQSHRYAFARFGLVHHDDNPDVVPPWTEYERIVADREMLFRLPASHLIAAGRDLGAPWAADWADYVCERYRLHREAR